MSMGEKKSALLAIDLQVGPLYGTHKREETLSEETFWPNKKPNLFHKRRAFC
jgi:hypothetical protein